MKDCLFCKIVNKDIPAEIIYEDKSVMAFKDINPQAPVHVLVIPKIHVAGMNDVTETNSEVIKEIFETIPKIVQQLNISETGYRLVSNSGEDGMQTVQHFHFHILGGRSLKWPPG
jgi:histidine triad (HIT) family protein